MRVYPQLINQEDWYDWCQRFVALARAHGVSDVVDPNVRAPRHYGDYTSPDAKTYEAKNAWAYALLQSIVKTPKGKLYIAEHKLDFDAKRVFAKLLAFGSRSTHAILSNERIMTTINTMRLDRRWNKTAVEFITQ